MNADDVGGVEGVVRRLYIYPVKSAAGVAVDAVEVDVFGPARDRRWLVVDGEAGGRALTQREAPPLALIRPSIGVDGGLALEAPAMERLELPPPSGIADGEATREGGAPGAPMRRVTVWKSVVDAIDAGDEAAEWVGRHLGRTCRLVHLPDDAVRRPPRHRRVGPGRLSFVDAAPFLVVTEAALEELNRRLVDPIPMDRFRPSIVVGGAAPHAEDGWPRVEVGGVALRRVKPCARCVIPTIDQSTGAAGREPLRTLARYRSKGGKVYFGQYFAHEAVGGRIAVGDRVVALGE